jgi:hypothetical protein
MKKPENLIAKDKMIDIVEDLTILKAARSTNVAVLQDNDLDPMTYIYEKYAIDSASYVNSDRYYASVPEEYEAIYLEVQERVKKERDRLKEQKRVNDSVKNKNREVKRRPNKLNDSLQ